MRLACVAALLCAACQKGSRTPEPASSTAPARPAAVAEPEPAPTVPGPGPVAPAVPLGEVAVLLQAANRKLMHDDGKGCLEELDRLKALDPKLESTLVGIRAQCEMLAGRCQAGKQALTDYYVRELNMAPELAKTSVEGVASMRCRGGDETDRDRLLRALRELFNSAKVFRKSSKFCVSLTR